MFFLKVICMKIAIVTGASKGLGAEFVKLLDKEQLDEIWVTARSKSKLEELRNICKTPLRVLPYDLTKDTSFKGLRRLLEEEKPSVAFLINAAGLGKIGSYADISLRDCISMIDLNCRAAVLLTQLVLPFMPSNSHVLEICSTAAFQPLPYFNLYGASKVFLYHYSRALNFELAAHKITVTAVCPYWIKDTDFIATARKTGNSSYIKNFIWGSTAKDIAAKALRDANKHRAVSTPGAICALHHFVCKFLPYSFLMFMWNLLRRCKF